MADMPSLLDDLDNWDTLLPPGPYEVQWPALPAIPSLMHFEMEWVLKKGRKKNQQYWVYCEESQTNYARFLPTVQGLQFGSTSCFLRTLDHTLVAVVDGTAKTTQGIAVYPPGAPATYQPFEMLPVLPSELTLAVELEADCTAPSYPCQGNAASVATKVEAIQDAIAPRHSFSVAATFGVKFNFTNREDGWFRVKSCLVYQGQVLCEDRSMPFMLNNPRMKKRAEYRQYSPVELKFMQCFSAHMMLRTTSEAALRQQWMEHGRHSGLDNVQTLLQKAAEFFPPAEAQRILGKRNSRT